MFEKRNVNFMDDKIFKMIYKNNEYGFFHSERWQSIVEKVYKVKASPRYSNNGNDYAFLTIFKVRNFFSGHKFTNMPFNFYPNPLYSNERQLITLINDLINESIDQKAYIEIKTTKDIPDSVVKKIGLIKTQPFLNSYLPIPDSYEKYFSNLKKSSRKNLNLIYKHFQKEGFTIGEVSSANEIDFLYKLMSKIYRDQHQMVCQPKSLFKNLFDYQDKNYSFRIFYIKKQNQYCSAIFSIFDNIKHIAYYSWAINENKFKEFSLNYVLVNELIKICIKNNFKGVDFGTSPLSDSNLLFFKNRWGCETRKVNLYYFNKIQNQPDLNSNYKIIRLLYSKIPVWLINLLNPFIIPQLS